MIGKIEESLMDFNEICAVFGRWNDAHVEISAQLGSGSIGEFRG